MFDMAISENHLRPCAATCCTLQQLGGKNAHLTTGHTCSLVPAEIISVALSTLAVPVSSHSLNTCESSGLYS